MNHLINGPTNVLMINQTINELKVEVCSVVSDSLRPHGLYPTRLLCPWDFPGNSTIAVCHFLLQGIFPTRESNPGLPHCRQTLYHLRLRTLHYLETNFRTWLVTLLPLSVDIGTFLGMPSVTISVGSNLTILQAASESWSGKVTNTQAKDSEKSSSQYLLSHFYRLWAWACFLYNLSYEI